MNLRKSVYGVPIIIIRTKLSNMNIKIRNKLRIIHVFEFCPLIDKRRRFHGILSKNTTKRKNATNNIHF